jgi:hypothetical protein
VSSALLSRGSLFSFCHFLFCVLQVREATSSDRWGVTDPQMHEISRATHDYEQYPKLFGMVWKRLTDVEHVMHVQKALILVSQTHKLNEAVAFAFLL